MKRTIALLLIVLAASVSGKSKNGAVAVDSAIPAKPKIVSSNPVLTNEAIEYYKALTTPLQSFKQANYEYLKAITKTRRARKIEKSRQELLRVLQSIKEHLKKSGKLHDDNLLKTEFERYVDITYIVLKEDFDKILDMEDIEAQTYDQEEAHQLALDLAVEKLHACFDVLRKAEKEYFKKYEINVDETKDELSEKIEKANKALEYYNVINRIFHAANKQDNYARKAVGDKDVAALEQHAATLVSFADEGLKKLKVQPPFNGDNELAKVAIAALEFYRNEGMTTYPANVDFYIKTDSFQNAVKKLNSIKESARKQADVDEYNNAVNVYNKTVKEINKTNSTSFKKHKEMIDRWNKQVDQFFNKHS